MLCLPGSLERSVLLRGSAWQAAHRCAVLTQKHTAKAPYMLLFESLALLPLLLLLR